MPPQATKEIHDTHKILIARLQTTQLFPQIPMKGGEKLNLKILIFYCPERNNLFSKIKKSS